MPPIKSDIKTQAPSGQGRVRAFAGLFRQDWRYIRIILCALVLWFIGARILHAFLPEDSQITMNDTKWMSDQVIVSVLQFLAAFLLFRLYQFKKAIGKKALVPGLIQVAKTQPHLIVKGLVLGSVAVMTFALFLSNMINIKTTIPTLVPFYFDETAAKLDRFLFFGNDPWVLLSPLFDFPQLVHRIDFIYAAFWGILIVGVWFYCFTTNQMDIKRRYQFVLALIISFIVGGNIMAILFSSAGPVYYAHITGDETLYQGLMAELHRINQINELRVLDMQDMLWQSYENSGGTVNGISAVPSMHCATTLLVLIAFWKTPIARFLLIIFTTVIFVGSVLLAWHYAIDGLVIIPVVLASWKLAGWILQKLVKDDKMPVKS